MSIIDTMLAVPDHKAPAGPIYGHLGFALVLRRELLPMLQDGAGLGLATRVLGMQIIESEHIPPGHYMINGISYRYTKPTVDEMVAEAQKRLAAHINGLAWAHSEHIREDFADARKRLGVRDIDNAYARLGVRHPTPYPYFLQRQAA